MRTHQYLGKYTARLRDNIIGTAEEVKHIVSTKKFVAYSDLARVVNMYNEPGHGMKGLVFVKVEHLPDDVTAELKKQAGEEGYEYFSRFCQLIGFTTVIHFSSASDPTQTTVPILGFPLPFPAAKNENRQRNEHTTKELQAFMGTLFPYASRAIVVELKGSPSAGAHAILTVFKQYAEILTASQ
jgi:hypothetical protein